MALALVVIMAFPVIAQDADRYDCDDFETQEGAQKVYDQDPSDPYMLDNDGDGIPCDNPPYEDVVTGDADDQDDTQGDDQQGEMVTKTFKLTLRGDVPEGEAFYVVYGDPLVADAPGEVLVFCGVVDDSESGRDCVGGGMVYTASAEVEEGSEIYVLYQREGSNQEPFVSTIEVVNSDMTNSGWYAFSGDMDNDHQGGVPDQLPGTGLGGMAGVAGLPIGNVAAVLSLLVVGGHAMLRRR